MSHEDQTQDRTVKKGLNTEIHAALLNENLTLIKTQFQQPKIPKGRDGVKNNQRKRHWNDKSRVQQENVIDNPYLTAAQHSFGTNIKRKRILDINNFHTVPGGMSEQYERQRQRDLEYKTQKEEQRKQREQHRLAEMEMVRKGEKPDTKLKEADFIITQDTIDLIAQNPWDLVYMDKSLNKLHDKYTSVDYRRLNSDDESEEEEEDDDDDDDDDDEEENTRPSIRYVLHPVPVTNDTVSLDGALKSKKLFLTKKEMKKLRRNRRKLDRQVLREKIKLGIEPKPEPKVRMKNIMKVVQNNVNISDPTSFEKQVKEQIDQRLQTHISTNKQRHETAVEEQKRAAAELKEKRNNLINSGENYKVHGMSFKISKLLNPKHRYKINMNCKQKKIQGCCLRLKDTGECILIIQGSEKSCKFLENLVVNRIDWNENFTDKDSNEEIDMSDCVTELKWSGEIESPPFKGKFFMKECYNLEHLLKTLDEFNSRQYWT